MIGLQLFLNDLNQRDSLEDDGRFPFSDDGPLSVATSAFFLDVSSGLKASKDEATAIGVTAGSPCNISSGTPFLFCV